MARNVIQMRKLGLLQFCHTFPVTGVVGCRCSQRLYGSTSPDIVTAETDTDTVEDQRVPAVGMTANGRTLICWHPEPKHPYHHTKPLSRNTEEASQGDSVLKPQLLRDEAVKFRPDGPTIRELANITYTTKHRWYNHNKKKFQKLDPPKDREGV